MDNQALREIINKISILKYKYLGSYPANFIPKLKNQSFVIVNTETSDSDGEHWILLANRGGNIFYADSMGLPLERYQNIQIPSRNITRLVWTKLQNDSLCGLYCIYFAWIVFGRHKLEKYFNDFDLLRFIYKFL